MSFVERVNLPIRQGSSYLSRRSAGHAGYADYLDDQMALLQCHYNFIRPHRSLKLGKERRTPAWQAGLVSRQLTFCEIFLNPLAILLLLFVYVRVAVWVSHESASTLWQRQFPDGPPWEGLVALVMTSTLTGTSS